MKRLTLPLLMLLSPAAMANWTLQSFPAFDGTSADGLFTSHATLPKGELPLKIYQDQQCWQPTAPVKLNQTLSLQPCGDNPPVNWRLFRTGEYQVRIDTRSGTPTLQLSLKTAAEIATAAATRTLTSRQPLTKANWYAISIQAKRQRSARAKSPCNPPSVAVDCCCWNLPIAKNRRPSIGTTPRCILPLPIALRTATRPTTTATDAAATACRRSAPSTAAIWLA